MLRYGDLEIDPPLILAPMAGITDRQFRLVLRRLGGVGLVTMEFISSEGLLRNCKQMLRKLHFVEEERPISIQIYGSKPDRMADAAEIVEQMGADACDINMGCPANKILKGCAGCALMADLDNAAAIVREVRKRLTIPLTVKFRAGIDDNRINFLELGKICQEEGAQAVALHPRTGKQMYRGHADWTRIAQLKDALSIPVVGNGDVNTAQDAMDMWEQTGCDAVMIGRASMKNPWIYRQINELRAGLPLREPSLDDRRDLILKHFRMVLAEEPIKIIMNKLRTFTSWYTKGLPGGRDLRVQIGSLDDPEAFFDAIEAFFEKTRSLVA